MLLVLRRHRNFFFLNMRDKQVLTSGKIILSMCKKEASENNKALCFNNLGNHVGKRSNRFFKDKILRNIFKVKISRPECELGCFIKEWT